MSKLKNVLKRVALYVGATVFLNYFSLPIGVYVGSRAINKQIRNRRIQQVCGINSGLEGILACIDAKNCDALTLVKLAHAISARHLTYETFVSEDTREINKALEEGRGDCSSYSLFTYSNFLYLADRSGRQDLKDKVRLCRGVWGDEGHAWLQIYLDDKWKDYETTIDRWGRSDLINLDLDARLPNYLVFIENGYYPFNYTQFENEELVTYINYFASIKSGVGCISAFINYLKDR